VNFGAQGWLVVGITAGLLAAASPAAAVPTIDAPACVGYQGNLRNLPIQGSGFAPGSYVSVRYEAPRLGEPRSAALLTADASGSFSTALVPPSTGSIRVNDATYTLSAFDPLRPALFAATTFKVTRIRLSVRPRASTDSGRRARFDARGFERGSTVYAHFRRFGAARAERTVALGRSRGACGRAAKRMALVPGGDVETGSWIVDVDTERRYSPSTKPQAGVQVIIQRKPPRRR